MGTWRTIILSSFLLAVASPAWGRVFLRWTEPSIPSARAIGVSELVIPWGPGKVQLMTTAKKCGYRVFAEASSQDAGAAADAAAANGLAGVIVEGGSGAPHQAGTQNLVESLRRSHPKLSVFELDSGGKQPQIQGSMVIERHGVLVVTSSTRKPWIDSNVALTRFVKTFQPNQTPLFSFSWELNSPVEKQEGPRLEDYALAIAEAGAMRSDLVLPVFPRLQKALAEGNRTAWQEWDHVRDYIGFYSKESQRAARSSSDIAIVTENYGDSYEPMNLLARHNIPFQVFRPGEITPAWLSRLQMVILFSKPDEQVARELQDFSSKGGTVVLVNVHGSFPWDNLPSTQESYGKKYKVGQGEIAEFAEPVEDPEEFAERIRHLRNEQDVLIRLWNALTTLAFAYPGPKAGNLTLELVNYAQEPLGVQVRVKGSFSNIRYETPEHGFYPEIRPEHQGGFTQFVVPHLIIGGRVYLSSKTTQPR